MVLAMGIEMSMAKVIGTKRGMVLAMDRKKNMALATVTNIMALVMDISLNLITIMLNSKADMALTMDIKWGMT
jgi:hypothetical protein